MLLRLDIILNLIEQLNQALLAGVMALNAFIRFDVLLGAFDCFFYE